MTTSFAHSGELLDVPALRSIDAMAGGNPTDLVCADSAAELGEPGDWLGLSAGEPERFFAD